MAFVVGDSLVDVDRVRCRGGIGLVTHVVVVVVGVKMFAAGIENTAHSFGHGIRVWCRGGVGLVTCVVGMVLFIGKEKLAAGIGNTAHSIVI